MTSALKDMGFKEIINIGKTEFLKWQQVELDAINKMYEAREHQDRILSVQREAINEKLGIPNIPTVVRGKYATVAAPCGFCEKIFKNGEQS